MDLYENNKKLEVENELLPDLGIMISYGIRSDLVSMGVFFVNGYYDVTGKKLENLPFDKTGVEVEFVEYELTENLKCRKKENGSRIFLPYEKVKKMYVDSSSANYDKVSKIMSTFTSKTYEGRSLLMNFDEILSDRFAKDPDNVMTGGTPNLTSLTLESLNGSFISNDGNDMGVDFCVFPFLYDMLKYKYRELNLNNEKDPKDYLYNYIRLLNYDNQININKEKEKDIGLGGTIYEPGPALPKTPEVLYEQEQEREQVHIHR